MSGKRDDMVIQPTLRGGKGSDRDAASKDPSGRRIARGKDVRRRGGGGVRRAGAGRAIRKARSVWRTANVARTAAMVVAPAAAAAAVLAAVALKSATGMTFEQMAGQGEKFFFGEAAMRTRAAAKASGLLMSSEAAMMTVAEEGRRAKASGGSRPVMDDMVRVHGQLTDLFMRDEVGMRGFILNDERFRIEAVADILATEAADFARQSYKIFRLYYVR